MISDAFRIRDECHQNNGAKVLLQHGTGVGIHQVKYLKAANVFACAGCKSAIW